MGEYYCTNCGADLETQDGFDPDTGYWICRECGQRLTDPDVHNTSDRFEGVSWFCDRCGAFLNKQPGFSDNYGSWTCTECGCYNRISEDEIDDSENEEDTISDTSSSFEKINSVLDSLNRGIEVFANIAGVDLDSSTDSEYGTAEDNVDDEEDDDEEYEDYEEEEEEDVRIINDIRHYQQNPRNNPHASQNKKSNESDAKPRVLNSDYLKPERAIFEQNLRNKEEANRRQQQHQNQQELNIARRKKVWRAITRKKQTPSIASLDCIGMPYQSVVKILKGREFSNINAFGEEDLGIDNISQENTVKSISIDGKTEFDSETWFSFGARINITYHQIKRAPSPYSSKGVRGLEYDDVFWDYKNAGFQNIILSAICDLKTGLLVKDGSVESVKVDEKSEFKRNEKFRIDVPIIITYHTFPKDNE